MKLQRRELNIVSDEKWSSKMWFCCRLDVVNLAVRNGITIGMGGGWGEKEGVMVADFLFCEV